MKTYIALLRGINVSGQKKIPMADLRQLMNDCGFKNVKTYIQTGNIIFKTDHSISQSTKKIADAIKKHFDYEVPVIVVEPGYIKQILDECPFEEEKKIKSYFTLLYTTPDIAMVSELNKLNYPDEEFLITDKCIYFFSGVGYGRTKFNNNFFERKLKVTATARNYNTMMKLLSLSQELA